MLAPGSTRRPVASGSAPPSRVRRRHGGSGDKRVKGLGLRVKGLGFREA